MAKKKKNTIINTIAKIISIISIIILLIFMYSIINLGMIPNNYLTIIFGILFFIYFVLFLFAFIPKIRKGIKIFACLIYIVFSTLFIFGIHYIDTTSSFIDKIDNNLSQKEVYYLVSLESDSKSNINEFDDKTIGFYAKSMNIESAVNALKEKISFNEIDFDDVIEMFESLETNLVDALLINESVKNLLLGDLNYLNINLKDIDTVDVFVETNDVVKFVDVTNTPFNIYIAGGDAYGSIDKIMNTDVNMIVTVDAKNHNLLLTSIPRDYYVHLSGFGDDDYDKLTHAGYYGIETSIKSIEELLDIDINYYAKINFSTVEKIVNSIGGIEIYNEYNFCANGCPDVCYNTGNIWLNGNRALMYARERVAFSNGDIQRVKNQQKIISAILDKVISSDTLINNYSKLLESVSESFSTNLDPKSIKKLVNQQIRNMSGWNIESQNLVGTDYFTTDTYTFPGTKLYTMKKDDDSVTLASNKIKEVLGD